MSDLNSLNFFDSNIWLYAFIEGQDARKEHRANELIQTIPNIIVSVQVINEVASNLLRKAGFSEQEIRELIDSFYELYTVVPLTQKVLLDASSLRERYHLSYWDGLIVASARASSASRIYSEDMHDGLVIEGSLTILNPFK